MRWLPELPITERDDREGGFVLVAVLWILISLAGLAGAL